MTDKAELQKIYDEWPDEVPLKEYDDFFVGGSSDSERPGSGTQSFAEQLTNISSVKDLRNPTKEPTIPTRDDRHEFITDRVDLLDDAQYAALFFAAKRAVFNVFNFTAIRSAEVGDVPMQELDLVMGEDDYYTADYLQDVTKDYHKVAQIAALSAYNDMGVPVVRFCSHDGCALCQAHDGLFYETRALLELLGAGGDVTHGYCECTWTPVIHRENYVGPLTGHLDRETIELEGTELRNVPVEFLSEIKVIAEELPYSVIKFVGMPDYLLNETTSVEDSAGVVAFVRGDELLVHNSYVGVYGPLEFLHEVARAKTTPVVIDVQDTENEEIYFVGGRPSIKRDGKFWDAETGERLV